MNDVTKNLRKSQNFLDVINYLNCNIDLIDKNGEQKTEYAIDGVHMYANGYLKVFDSLVQHLH